MQARKPCKRAGANDYGCVCTVPPKVDGCLVRGSIISDAPNLRDIIHGKRNSRRTVCYIESLQWFISTFVKVSFFSLRFACELATCEFFSRLHLVFSHFRIVPTAAIKW